MSSTPFGRNRLHKIPGKTLAALILIWATSVLGMVFACTAWVDYNNLPSYAQDGATSFLILLLMAGLVFNMILAIAIQARRNWARITAIVFGVLAAVLQLINLFSGDAFALIGMALNIVVVVLLASYDSSEWCDQ